MTEALIGLVVVLGLVSLWLGLALWDTNNVNQRLDRQMHEAMADRDRYRKALNTVLTRRALHTRSASEATTTEVSVDQ